MNQTAKKYVELFRQVKIAAATVDVQGHPQARAINPGINEACPGLQCGRCVEFCPVDAVDRLHP